MRLLVQYLAVVTLFIGMSLIFSTCDTQSCEGVVCPGNNSFCQNGQCFCEPGFEGEFCDELSQDKYVGAYQVSETCTSQTSGPLGGFYTTQIIPGGTIDRVTITNMNNRGLPVEMFLNGNFVTIPQQTVGAATFVGEGIYNELTRRIDITYQVQELSDFRQCQASFSRI